MSTAGSVAELSKLPDSFFMSDDVTDFIPAIRRCVKLASEHKVILPGGLFYISREERARLSSSPSAAGGSSSSSSSSSSGEDSSSPSLAPTPTAAETFTAAKNASLLLSFENKEQACYNIIVRCFGRNDYAKMIIAQGVSSSQYGDTEHLMGILSMGFLGPSPSSIQGINQVTGYVRKFRDLYASASAEPDLKSFFGILANHSFLIECQCDLDSWWSSQHQLKQLPGAPGAAAALRVSL